MPAGVGKGRQIAACVKQAHRQGVKRFLWITVSNDLKFDSERDLKDVDCDLTVYPKVSYLLCGLCCMPDHPEKSHLLCEACYTSAHPEIGCLLHGLFCMPPFTGGVLAVRRADCCMISCMPVG